VLLFLQLVSAMTINTLAIEVDNKSKYYFVSKKKLTTSSARMKFTKDFFC